MIKKYAEFLDMIDENNITLSNCSEKEITGNNSLEILIDDQPKVQKQQFLNKKDVELLFPGHVRSYYASCEF